VGGQITLIPTKPKIITEGVRNELGKIRVRCLSPNEKLFEAYKLFKAAKIPFSSNVLVDKMIVNEDGSRNNEVCNALQAEYGISDLWCNIFAHEAPNTKIGEVIEREYLNGETRRIITSEDLRDAENIVFALKDLLIPGKDFEMKMKNGVLEIMFDPKNNDLINFHELPVEAGKYVNRMCSTNLLTGIPDPNGKGPKRYGYFWSENSAVSAVYRCLDNFYGVNLGLYYPRGVLEIKQDA